MCAARGVDMLPVGVNGPLDCAIAVGALPLTANKKNDSTKLASSDALKLMPLDVANCVFNWSLHLSSYKREFKGFPRSRLIPTLTIQEEAHETKRNSVEDPFYTVASY